MSHLWIQERTSRTHSFDQRRARVVVRQNYLTITRDLTRVMSRLKAIYRSWAISCAGQHVYAPLSFAKIQNVFEMDSMQSAL
jgi:hypothetical protein